MGVTLPGFPTHGDGIGVTGQVLAVGESLDTVGDLRQTIGVVIDDVHGAHEGTYREPRGVTGSSAGGKDVGRSRRVVPQRHRGPLPDEDGPGIVDSGGHLRCIGGVNLQVLGGVVVDDGNSLLQVTDQHDRGLL